MYKISVNDTFGGITSLTLGCFPLFFYFGLATLLNWHIKFNEGIIIYCCFSSAFLWLSIKFGCLDWDFYIVKGEGFLFKKLRRITRISKGTNFEIKPILFVSFQMKVFLIRFDNGERFYFRYNKYQMPLMSFDGVINQIRSIISDTI